MKIMSKLSEWNPGEPLPDEFISIAQTVYKDDPYWLGENASDLRKTLSFENLYFERATAKGWIVPGRSRLVAFFDPDLQIEGQLASYFGYWESVDDAAANVLLFESAQKWAKEHGAKKMYGPINFNTYGKYRIKLNFQPGEGCFIGEPYNPPYYQKLLEHAGFSLESKYISQILDQKAIQKLSALRHSASGTSSMPFKMQSLTADYWCEHLDGFYSLIDSIFNQNFAYSPISKETFLENYGRAFAQKFSPMSSLFVTDDSGNVIGFCIGFPDFSPLCRPGAVHPIPMGSISYDEHFKLLSDPVLLIKTAGVDARFRKHGLLTAMAAKILAESKDIYHHAVMCLIKEGNYSAEFCKPVAAHVREYGLFSKHL